MKRHRNSPALWALVGLLLLAAALAFAIYTSSIPLESEIIK